MIEHIMFPMEVRIPVYIGELAEKAGETVEKAAKLADELVHSGAVEHCN